MAYIDKYIILDPSVALITVNPFFFRSSFALMRVNRVSKNRFQANITIYSVRVVMEENTRRAVCCDTLPVAPEH